MSAQLALDEDLSTLLVRGLGFRRITAGQAITPRVQVVVICRDAPVWDLLALLKPSGRSGFPVLASDVDDVIGVVGLAELLPVSCVLRPTTTAAGVAAAPVLVPATRTLRGGLEMLREQHRQLAIVVDEYGGFDEVGYSRLVVLDTTARSMGLVHVHDETDRVHRPT